MDGFLTDSIRSQPMFSRSRSQLIMALALVLACAIDAALPATAQRAPTTSLAGQLLVAAPSIGDPRFQQAVILVVRHDKNGAFGIIVNRPIGEQPLARLLERFGDNETAATGEMPMFFGGPVQPELGFVLHSSDYRRDETIAIDARVAMTSTREILRDIGNSQGPKQVLIALGYAGWGPEQLEGEFKRRSWSVASADPHLIFEVERDKVWELAYAQRLQDL
jgi:putative transcriptional regulator